MIALVDYGAGNLASVRKALAALGVRFWTPSDPADLARATGIIVPGVGHFNATTPLDDDWRRGIRAALDRRAPLLGICVGMQWLFDGSSEAPDVPGLGVVAGMCAYLGERQTATGNRQTATGNRQTATGNRQPADGNRPPALATSLKVPHVGWNSLSFPGPSRLFQGVAEGTQVYFTHSYAAPLVPATAAVTRYGVPFSAAVEDDLVSGVQFHPEKSGDAGLRILGNWLDAT